MYHDVLWGWMIENSRKYVQQWSPASKPLPRLPKVTVQLEPVQATSRRASLRDASPRVPHSQTYLEAPGSMKGVVMIPAQPQIAQRSTPCGPGDLYYSTI